MPKAMLNKTVGRIALKRPLDCLEEAEINCWVTVKNYPSSEQFGPLIKLNLTMCRLNAMYRYKGTKNVFHKNKQL